ncbi:MAG: FCD domain-containing protein [Pseudolabrys sp.]
MTTATGNPQFTRFLEYLGSFIIPRRSIWNSPASAARRVQLDTFQKEHEQILQAIEGRAVSQARQAMQHHLLNSRQRYQKLAGEHGPQ